ncbi:hypothetical protein LTR37_007895 [Vermiconidia calcicola]|uniref:Uncharacterized protein n=1 Tax=Vermiconidia calcicola TaxID=1690605 RepID=A0ACC3NCA4_9PEZI|nr:hypothetical protein LTR37_007895 [Vermiconidia calcicola]
MATITATTETCHQPGSIKPSANKTADLTLNATLEKFQQPSSDEDYYHAVSLIESKLDKFGSVNAVFTVNLGPNQPELLIDARHSPATMSKLSSGSGQPSDVSGALHMRPHMIQRWVDGLMEARYSLSYGHIHLAPGTPPRIGTKFVDGLTPFGAVHPKLDPNMIFKLPKPTEDVAQIKRDLKDFGYGLLKNAISREELKRLQVRLKEQAQGEADTGVGFFDGGENKPNQRVWNLPNKGQEFIDLLDHNPTFENFVPQFLGEDAYLFSYTANIAKPGNTPMNLHTDQITIQPPIRDVAFGLNFMFFLTDITPELGGTLVMPASHRGNLAPDDPYDAHSDTVSAHGPAGTLPGSERPVIIVFFMRSFVRQQENWALSLRDDVLEGLSDKVKGYLGFRSVGTMGGVEGKTKDGTIVGKVKTPIGVLRPKAVTGV